MDDDENQRSTTPTEEDRPSTAHQMSSSDGRGHVEQDNPETSSNATTQRDARQPSQHATPRAPSSTNLTGLRPPNVLPDSSLVEGITLGEDSRTGDSQAEHAVRAHLQDVESSFMSLPSPIPAFTQTGADDTYLFDGKRNANSNPASSPTRRTGSARPEHNTTAPAAQIPSTTPNDSQNDLVPLQRQDSVSEDVSNTTSSLENFSSPTAAASRRTVSRALSGVTSEPRRTISSSRNMDQQHGINTKEEEYPAAGESSVSQLDVSQPSTTSQRQKSSDQGLYKGLTDAGSTPGHAVRSGKQPKYLRSRVTSQRSSVSSVATNPDSQDDLDSDVTVGMGPDYAVPPGAAVQTMPRSASNVLSRSVSMGSMVSGIDDTPDMGQTPLETLEESPQRRSDGGNDMLYKTPKPTKDSLSAPTDTVIARHVRNVHVPESLAKEYKSKTGLVTPRRPSDATPVGTGRSGKNMTLKEQSSTIERLSKENFDLKLKVMFLSDRLDKLSEEGIKEMISENVDLKTSLAVIQRDNKALRRRVKELEKKLKEDEDRPSTARSGASSNDQTAHFFDQEAQEREEELTYLREKVEEYVVEIEKLRHDSLSKEAEKRKLTDVVKSLGERTGENLGRQEEADVWKDLLEQETARREQADDDNRRLRDEVFKMKQEMSAPHGGGLHHTTNIYNITKKNRERERERERQGSPNRPVSGLSGEMDTNAGLSTASTLVDELRRESEQLRHENAELRREVGAQTSMLTSRNREKERLYQEIEDLKIAQRRGGPAPSTVDSILERSASRVGGHHQRSASRASGTTRTQVTEGEEDDPERDELENKLAEARDRINEVKLHNQGLQQELDGCMVDFETAVEGKQQAEDLAAALQEDLDTAMNDLVTLQAERDEALREQGDMEAEFEALRKEAQEEIDTLEGEADQRSDEMQQLQYDLNDRSENFGALQEEMRKMSEALVRLEDEQESKAQQIQQLEQDVSDANKESEVLEQRLRETNDKGQRLGVQQESSQSEIAFLREEQEGDKIRIGDLEAAIEAAETSLREERERVRELEQRLAEERQQREMVANQEKEEVQQFVNELNREMSTAKDEARRLRKNLTSREVEAAEWKERLLELENNLREALGDLNGTRFSFLKSIAKIQRDQENTALELDTNKASLAEKDRIIKQRDSLLESHGLELRRLSDLLNKEQQAHRTTKHQHETFQKTHGHVSRTVTSQDTRIAELEAARGTDRKRIAGLEASLRDQLAERNTLLLQLWTRLSALCGSDWAHDNSLINGRALPSLESVGAMLPGFSKNLMAAVRTVETMVGGFSARIKDVERELWREYEALQGGLDQRYKKLERLESIVRNGVATGNLNSQDHMKMARLEETIRQYEVENRTMRTARDVRSRAAGGGPGAAGGGQSSGEGGGGAPLLPDGGSGSPSPLVPTGPSNRDGSSSGQASRKASRRGLDASEHRGGSSGGGGRGSATPTGSGTMTRLGSSAGGGNNNNNHNPYETTLAERGYGNAGFGPPSGSAPGSASGEDKAWMFRLRDLEVKLKTEREARTQDRNAARQRLGGLENENRDLRGEMVKMRKAAAYRE